MKPWRAKVTIFPSLRITVEGSTSACKEMGSACAGMFRKIKRAKLGQVQFITAKFFVASIE
jgi:hypothetical protein